MTDREIGFVGVGNIGAPMARALRIGGWQVAVHDTALDRAKSCLDSGARWAAELRDLGGCELVSIAVPDDEQVRNVVRGLAECLATGSILAVHSTVLPRTLEELVEECDEAGLSILDAPVSGGPERALRGELTMVLGGSDAAVETARPALQAMADRIVRVGAVGAAAAAKLANQLMMFSALAGVHEALRLAEAHGVTEEQVLDVVRSCTGASWVTENWGFFDKVVQDYDRNGVPVRYRTWSKDLWDVVAAARDCDVRVPLAGLLAQHLAEQVEEHGHRPR
ncbi:NAD(P)-dependent oxidoreductase [Saccharopolyspora sp. K220]|uniref:NAD(P)-dependent oxidoreductase n=1 Tax=Saccharopolyspora soli TaxID=2926618 RepID=UPI001F55DD02|nr:NAD(P)-dependent oxidoreductase [Saccharopolyspora soli]MCI2417865.1 NAD(P)-dependent oxidoreductase [Saccharopolyspora soli]